MQHCAQVGPEHYTASMTCRAECAYPAEGADKCELVSFLAKPTSANLAVHSMPLLESSMLLLCQATQTLATAQQQLHLANKWVIAEYSLEHCDIFTSMVPAAWADRPQVGSNGPSTEKPLDMLHS